MKKPIFKQIHHYLYTGVDIKIVGEEYRLMHHKFCLIDTNQRLRLGTVITGSLNWTYGVCVVLIYHNVQHK